MYKVLDLYAGVGGNRKKMTNCEVTAVEYSPAIAEVYQGLYPNDTVVVADAHQYLLDHHHEFDFVWSSPPCQSHSRMMKATRHNLNRYPDMKLYEEIIFLQNFFKGNWVVENVVPYYAPLIPAQKVGRHLFWSNFDFTAEDVARPKNFINKANLAGKKELMDWLGIHYEKNLYYEGNHCPAQVLRNCVHPDLGKQIFEQGMDPALKRELNAR
jgi:DNA (cytosine-5)-methyltransferase 1